ncbi:hypothetical protein Tco_0019484 [Tanacetum coccineum]
MQNQHCFLNVLGSTNIPPRSTKYTISGSRSKLLSCLNWHGWNSERVAEGDIFNQTSLVVGCEHAVATALAQNDNGSLEAESIVRAASTRVRFHLSTTPFCSGVRGVEV